MKRKKYKCREKAPGCHGEYFKRSSFQAHCDNLKCALKKLDRDKANKKKEERRQTRAEKLALKTRREWIKDLQKVFNQYIRLRDKKLPCISCGKYDHEIRGTYTGGKWDAGHWKTRGGFPELRFEELNCHKQCKSCNSPGPRKADEVRVQYRINLIEKIGLDRVEWLEGPHEMPRLTIGEIKHMIKEYRDKIKDLNNNPIDI